MIASVFDNQRESRVLSIMIRQMDTDVYPLWRREALLISRDFIKREDRIRILCKTEHSRGMWFDNGVQSDVYLSKMSLDCGLS